MVCKSCPSKWCEFFFHLWIFLSPPYFPNKHFRTSLSRVLKDCSVSFSSCMWKTSNELRTDDDNVIRPAFEWQRSFHLDKLASDFWMMSLESALLLPLWRRWHPKYFPRASVGVMPSRLLNLCAIVVETFGEKNTWVLEKLTFWPDALQKRSRLCLIRSTWSSLASANHKTSSAKSKWEKDDPKSDALRGFHSFIDFLRSIQ